MDGVYPRQEGNQDTGKPSDTSTSVSALVSTLVPTVIAAIIFLAVFLILRKKKKNVYGPRTYLDVVADEDKTPTPANNSSIFGWIGTYRRLPDTFILNHHSLDGYLSVRYLKVLLLISVVGCCITWPILFPINATGGGGASQLDILTFGNVDNPVRYFAHAAVAWVFFGFVMFIIARESVYLVKLRQAYLLSPWQASRMSARTVLFTSVPTEYQSESAMATLFPQARHIWIPREAKALEGLLKDAEKTAFRLEEAIVKYCRGATEERNKHGDKSLPSSQPTLANHDTMWDEKARPRSRKHMIGHKEDTIESTRSSFASLRRQVQDGQASHSTGKMHKPLGAAFVEFASQLAAEEATAPLAHHKPSKIQPSQVGVRPDEVVWKNLSMNSWAASLRHIVCTAAICVMILFWGIPVAFVGVLSNVNLLVEKVPFLDFINEIPDQILGVVTGLLPVLLLALLIALVPVICRFLAKQSGAMTLSQVELQTQSWYFAFVLIQVFLVTTFASSATAVVSDVVSDPMSAPQILARNLPKASNFYLSYFVLQGIAISALRLLNPGTLFKKGVLGSKRFSKTPRKMFARLSLLNARLPGTDYPKHANLGVIAIVYSCIAPLVLGFAVVCFTLLHLAFKYNFLYAYGPVVDTRGAAYARALQHLMVGLYLAELCLIGLFGVGSAKSATSAGPLAMTVVLLAATIIFHVILRRRVNRLVDSLSRDLPRGAGHHHILGPNGDVENHGNGYHKDQGHGQATEKQRLSAWQRRTAAPRPEDQLSPRFRQALPASYYPEHIRRTAFLHPAVSAEAPVLWIVRDDLGLSQKEMRGMEGIVAISDDGTAFDSKCKVDWRHESVRDAPIWKDRILW